MRATVALFVPLLAALVCAAPAAAQHNGLARTPPMGWNSWYAFHCRVNEQNVLDNANALIGSGMASAGYRYVNVDGCWEARTRDANGALQANPSTFPDGMAALARRIHALGLKFGIYTSAGRTICNHPQPGSFGHFKQDLRTFASWGVDYVKVDWCNPGPGEHPQPAYAAIAAAARSSGRRMIIAVSTIGLERAWTWAGRDGNVWRITRDAMSNWRSVLRIAAADAPLWRYAGPGGWNDADILQVGNGRLTLSEDRSQLSLWSMLASPLLAGNNLPAMSPAVRSVLTNRDVIAVDQDPLGRQAQLLQSSGGHQVWLRRLANGSRAVLVLNEQDRRASVNVDLPTLSGMPAASSYTLRDLWTHATRTTGGRLRLNIAAHGVVMLRVRPAATGAQTLRARVKPARRLPQRGRRRRLR